MESAKAIRNIGKGLESTLVSEIEAEIVENGTKIRNEKGGNETGIVTMITVGPDLGPALALHALDQTLVVGQDLEAGTERIEEGNGIATVKIEIGIENKLRCKN